MFDPLLLYATVPDSLTAPTSLGLQFLRDLARHVDPNAALYVAAATVARFWHEHMWMVYVAMAYITIIGLHH
jgi:hypothetical protein